MFCRLIPFPKERLLKEAWLKQFNRTEEYNSEKLLQPKRWQRVCSVHFVDRQPTHENPLPELLLVQDKKKRAPNKRKMKAKAYQGGESPNYCPSPNPDDSIVPSSAPVDSGMVTSDVIPIHERKFTIFFIFGLIKRLRTEIAAMKKEREILRFHIIKLRSLKEAVALIPFNKGIGSTSRTCYATGCTNSDQKLIKWRGVKCEEHAVPHDSEMCSCEEPFR